MQALCSQRCSILEIIYTIAFFVISLVLAISLVIATSRGLSTLISIVILLLSVCVPFFAVMFALVSRGHLLIEALMALLIPIVVAIVWPKPPPSPTLRKKLSDEEFAGLLRHRELKAAWKSYQQIEHIVHIGYEQNNGRFYMKISGDSHKNYNKAYFLNLQMLKSAIVKETGLQLEDFVIEYTD